MNVVELTRNKKMEPKRIVQIWELVSFCPALGYKLIQFLEVLKFLKQFYTTQLYVLVFTFWMLRSSFLK